MSTPSLHMLDAHQREVAKLLHANCGKHRLYEVFRDFCELSALSISNAVDRLQFDKREARYLEIIGSYAKEEVARFPEMLSGIVLSLEAGFKDCLGELFAALELADHWKGQFFTPYVVARMMAEMALADIDAEWLQEHGGILTLNEPAVGAGAMVIAAAHTLYDRKINYQQCLHVTAQDVDATAVHMAYIQLSLLHVPALIIHGNTLTVEAWEHWATPAHVVGLWDGRLRAGRARVDASSVLLPETDAAEAAREPVRAETGRAELAQARATIVEKRVEGAGQLDLF